MEKSLNSHPRKRKTRKTRPRHEKYIKCCLRDGKTHIFRSAVLAIFCVFLDVLTPSWRPLGSIWEGSGLHLGCFWCPFSSQFPNFCTHIFSNLSPMLKHLLHLNLVCDGLVGLREAQRIANARTLNKGKRCF